MYLSNVRLIREFFTGFAQKRRSDGSFVYTDPIDCSPQDNSSRSCSLQADNEVGFYESSSWEYSWYVIIFQYLKIMNDNYMFQGLLLMTPHT